MNLKTEPKVLKCLLAVNLDVNIWSARRKLQPNDFAHSLLPPEKLASLGSKRICSPDELRIFGTLKARAVSLLDKCGVRFLGGWAIPEKKAAEIVKGIEAIQDDFNQAKKSFMARYDQAIQDWIGNNPGWEQMIATSVVSADYVSKRIAFNWQVFKVVNPTGRKKDVLETGLQSEVGNLGGTLFDEVAKTAKDAFNKSFVNKSMITRKALSPLKNIQQKLSDLSFIEPRVAPVASLIETAIAKIPGRGAIQGNDLLLFQVLLVNLSDPAAITKYAQEIIDGRSKEDILTGLIEPKKVKNTPSDKDKKKANTDKPGAQLESYGLW